uniref:ArfGAP with RhoGAP domain, ankyrin repeat and PH domain 2 n=1 Tax=Takifugu rubripes TaxID=31033 RepID=H2UKC4_TAKRU
MLEPGESIQEVVEWLLTLRLSQYTSAFLGAGYRTLEDCRELTEERLLELKILPTGHRRRLLRSLEALGVKQGLSYQHPPLKESKDQEKSHSLPPGSGLVRAEVAPQAGCVRPPQPAPRKPENIQIWYEPPSIPPSVSSSSSGSPTSSDWDLSPGDPPRSSSDSSAAANDTGGFAGEMVENAIYEARPRSAAAAGPRPTRSYRLRHRPVPSIPTRATRVLRHAPIKVSNFTSGPHFNREKAAKPKESKEDPTQTPEDEYSTVTECARILTSDGAPGEPASSGPPLGSLDMVECELYSLPTDALEDTTAAAMPDISPYACFYGAGKSPVLKAGWLDKLSPQGKCVFQRRWVRLDGESLAYYNNEKEMYSKGMILASAIRHVRGHGDKFEVATTLRTFIFRAEREGERQEWVEALQTATQAPVCGSQKPSDSLPSANKLGLLELRGYKGRVLVSLAGSKVRLCKTEQDHRAGLAISEVELTAANISNVDRRSFDLNTPFRSFCFTAESEREKEEWIEAVQESIAETLSDYEVAEKIWFNEANRSCADCRAPQPEWASINLGVVICKKCAGQHRSLGPSISKVRSLKLDSSIWSNELVELFLEVGNMHANSFWAANLPLEEEIHSGALAEQRATFIRRKYRERKYRRVLEGLTDPEQLNKALCAAVASPSVLQTMELVFSGADAMCATGDPLVSTPYLLAQRAGQRLQMEFLHHNKLTDFPRMDHWSENASQSDFRPFMDGFLYLSWSQAKTSAEHMTRRWCTLEGGFLSYYESERSAAALGRVDVGEVVSLAVHNTETMTGAGAAFTAELYLQTERVLNVGAETQETQQDWIQALTKCFVPPTVEVLVRRDSELIGRLHYKEGHDLYHWRPGWFVLAGSALHFSAGQRDGEEAVLQLKRLQELTVSTHTEGEEKIQVLLMVEGRRTLYVHGFSATDFSVWHAAIALAAGTDSRDLGDQQLTKNGVPIVVDSCVAFVTQYGLCQEGVYQRQGDPERAAQLLEEFTRDARNVKLRENEQRLEDVTDTLKNFLSQVEDALLAKELYPYWVSALDEKDESRRVKKYSTFIQSLPKVNRSTLEALLQHLYRIHQCSHLNHMPSEKLAAVFSPCLFQTQGRTPQEAAVVNDLIRNYILLFSVDEERAQQMEKENGFITRWNDKKDATVGSLNCAWNPAERCDPACVTFDPLVSCWLQVSPSMTSAELAETALGMKNVTFAEEDSWTTFEVIENGELERPLHHSEKILEQVLDWSGLESPRSACLVLKKFPVAEKKACDLKRYTKGGGLKFSDGSSKLLSGHKFQDKYAVLSAETLRLYRDIKGAKAEKTMQLDSARCYLGLKRKLKPPTRKQSRPRRIFSRF